MSQIKITAGDDYILRLIYKDSVGAVVDISGAVARMMVRKNYYADPIVDKLATIDGPAGKISFPFIPADTKNVLVDKVEETFLYDVELTEADTTKTTLLAGNLTVTQKVTRV